MKNKLLILDEFRPVKPEWRDILEEHIMQRPGLGKSRALKKAFKKINKRRKELGLKKIKTVELKIPKGWDNGDLIGFPVKR